MTATYKTISKNNFIAFCKDTIPSVKNFEVKLKKFEKSGVEIDYFPEKKKLVKETDSGPKTCLLQLIWSHMVAYFVDTQTQYNRSLLILMEIFLPQNMFVMFVFLVQFKNMKKSSHTPQ